MSEHECLRARRCARREVDQDGRVHGAYTGRPDSVCETCQLRAAPAIADLPRDYVRLELAMERGQSYAERVAGSPDPLVPLAVDVLDLQATIDATLSCWVEPVAERLRIDWDTTRMAGYRPGPRVSVAAGILSSQVSTLVNLGPVDVVGWCGGPIITTRTGAEAVLNLVDLHERAALTITGGTGDARLPVPCPHCQGMLVLRNGLDQVSCRGCGGTWPQADYQRLCLALAQDYRGVAV